MVWYGMVCELKRENHAMSITVHSPTTLSKVPTKDISQCNLFFREMKTSWSMKAH